MKVAEALGTPYAATGNGPLGRAWRAPGTGRQRLRVREYIAAQRPNAETLRRAWKEDRDGAAPLLIFWDDGAGSTLIVGPTAEGAQERPTITQVTREAAGSILKIALDAPAPLAVRTVRDLLDRAQGSGNAPGFRNRGVISTHCALESFRRDADRWERLRERAARADGKRGVDILRALGYEKSIAPGTFVFEHRGRVAVYAATIAGETALDRAEDGATSIVADVLAKARERGAVRAVIVANRRVRTYVLGDEVAYDDLSTPSTYVEVDLDLVERRNLPILAAIAAVPELAPGGTFDDLLAESRRYAVALRKRFQSKVYGEIIDSLITAIYRRAHPNDPQTLLDAALLLLYRLLFVLYAEDRNLLPLNDAVYQANSLTAKLAELDAYQKSGRAFDERAADLWQRLVALFDGIANGHREWSLPPYDGGLFEHGAQTIAGAALLDAIDLPNAELAPLLLKLTYDTDEDGESGKIDFADLGVRYLGTLYEGLLSFAVVIADRNLAAAPDGYRTAKKGDAVVVAMGSPYLITPNGGRKISGTYYTPSFVVRRLLNEALLPALERHLARVGALPLAEQWAAMLDFRVVDPAMGSGHFLVDALDTIAERMATFLASRPIAAKPYAQAREAVTACGREYGIPDAGDRIPDFDLLRRIVLKNCIYGVDYKPMAVELAKLGLWLHAFVPALPLSYLGHTLRAGNSLVGVLGDEIEAVFRDRPAGVALFWHAIQGPLEDARAQARAIGERADVSLANIAESKELEAHSERATASLRHAYDAYACRVFSDNLSGPLEDYLFGDVLAGDVDAATVAQLAGVFDAATELAAFHWQIAFPEVLLRDPPGFDVVLGNPPWEEITVERLGFYTRYIPGLKSVASNVEQEGEISSYLRKHPDVRAAYEREAAEKEHFRQVLHANFTLSRGGDPDMYRSFAELALRLCRTGGAIGMVYPRQLLAAKGSMLYRKALFGQADVIADFGLNRGGWMFPDAEHRYTIVALAAQKTGGGAISQAGPVTEEKAWSALPSQRAQWELAELQRLSEGFELPLFDDERGPDLFHRMSATGQAFSAQVGAARFRPWAPIHATNDRKSGLLKDRASGAQGWPVYGGRNFYLWEPQNGEPEFVLDSVVGLDLLQRKRLRSEVWEGTSRAVLDDAGTLPPMRSTILFRDVARATDSRTMIACLVPPQRFAANQAPTLVRIGGGERDDALRLGVMSSLPFDWIARRRVEQHMNFFILNALPVPRQDPTHPLAARAAELAARLACIDDRFAEFAAACGVDTGSLLDEQMREDAIAEIDALVAHLYDFEKNDLETIFDDFTLNAVPRQRRAAVRAHFERLAVP